MVDLSSMTPWELGKCFDQSVLPKDTTEAAIRSGCAEAVKYNCACFYSASSYWTPVVLEALAGSDVLPACAIGFPFGATTSRLKARETEEALELGCRALDMAMNIGALKSGRIDDVRQECAEFRAAAGDAQTKVILETCFLTDDEVRLGTDVVAEAGCDFVKSSSGQFEGPSLEDVLVMLDAVKGSETRVKVAGVKFPRPQNAYVFLLAGVDVIGTRAAPAIIDAFEQMREIGLVPAYRDAPAPVGAAVR